METTRGLRGDRSELALWVLLLLAAAVGYCLPPINPDEGAILDFATRMLSGKELYTDLVDVNPPMIFLLNLVPAALVRTLPLPVPVIVTGCLLLLPLLTIRSLSSFTHLASDRVGVRRVLALALVYVLMLYPGAEFSQREHLLLIATIPYLVNLHRRLQPGTPCGLGLRISEILPFAMMVCLKPHFALLPAMMEGMVLLHRLRRRERWPDLEFLLLLGVGLGYGLVTLLLFPNYLGRILPLADSYYGIADRTLVLHAFFGEQGQQFLMALAALVLVYLLFLRRLWLLLLMLAGVALYLASALQLKDWFYHFLPCQALALIGLFASAAVLLAERWHRVGPPLRRAAAWALLPLFIGVSLPVLSDDSSEPLPPLPYPAQRNFAEDGWAKVREIVATQAEGQTVMWLSQYNEGTARALAYARANLIAPTMSLWMLPALYERHGVADGQVLFHDPARMTADEKWLWNAVADGFFNASPPVLVYVKDDPGYIAGRFDYIAYFSMNPKFRTRLASYRVAYEDAVVRVYVRDPKKLVADLR